MLKFSAMEIYNEAVRDLLSGDCTPLRLLDDPEVNIFSGLKFCILFNRSISWSFYFLDAIEGYCD